jgi:hypothetical protein
VMRWMAIRDGKGAASEGKEKKEGLKKADLLSAQFPLKGARVSRQAVGNDQRGGLYARARAEKRPIPFVPSVLRKETGQYQLSSLLRSINPDSIAAT